MTSPVTYADEKRTHKDPVEIVARAMVEADSGPESSELFQIHWAEFGDFYIPSAKAALAALGKAGFLSDLYFDAKKARK